MKPITYIRLEPALRRQDAERDRVAKRMTAGMVVGVFFAMGLIVVAGCLMLRYAAWLEAALREAMR